MIEVTGRYNKAVIYSDRYDENAYKQIFEFCNLKSFEGSKIRIMPDYHAGAGCVIGFTADIADAVIPNVVGVDIGCGVLAVKLNQPIDPQQLDEFIRNNIPSGFEVHEKEQEFDFDNLLCRAELANVEHLKKSLGTLGGGNHFIELNVDGKAYDCWLVVHTGSRNLGKQVAQFYQHIAEKTQGLTREEMRRELTKIKPQEREKWLAERKAETKLPKGLEHLSGLLKDMYIHDMRICQNFAYRNRAAIVERIVNYFNIGATAVVESVHNYIDMDNNIIRKGAIPAYTGQFCIIPLNMRDGSLLCKGKGNPDWNFSAPHGAGRLLSRSQAKEKITLAEFKASMADIYSTSVTEATIDEAPMAYKPPEEIIEQIKDTVEIVDRLEPIYNFKAN